MIGFEGWCREGYWADGRLLKGKYGKPIGNYRKPVELRTSQADLEVTAAAKESLEAMLKRLEVEIPA